MFFFTPDKGERQRKGVYFYRVGSLLVHLVGFSHFFDAAQILHYEIVNFHTC